MTALTISEFQESDWPQVWAILEPVIRAGETFPCPPDMSEAEARRYWGEPPRRVFVARETGGVMIGTYHLRPDQIGLGDHVANCGYAIAPAARGRGYGLALCRHSQEEALKRGFTAMKFNLVVATNEAAVKAWLKSGMRIIGDVPNAFRHPRHGLVDAHIMYKDLTRF